LSAITACGNARVSYPQLPFAAPNDVLGVANGSRGEQRRRRAQDPAQDPAQTGPIGFWISDIIYIWRLGSNLRPLLPPQDQKLKVGPSNRGSSFEVL
jgi:hypothetical protein